MESIDTHVVDEWEKVKHEPSLYRYYGSQKEYQKWRTRFLKVGLIQRSSRIGKRQKNPRSHLLEYRREYYSSWRKNNKQKQKEYAYTYWKRRLVRDIDTMVRLRAD
jgi:hypothetical protein